MNKYHARRTPCNQGHVHASKLEALECNRLALRLRAREIKEYYSQYDFKLYAGADTPLTTVLDGKVVVGVHIVDFYIPELKEVREAKGKETALWKLKRKIFEANYPGIKYVIVTK